MQRPLRSVLAAIPVLAALALAPGASATCNAINATVQNGKAWYGAADAPPTLIFNIADDEGTYHDTMNEVTGTYFASTFAGPFAWVATPAWSTYARGWNNLRLALFCSGGNTLIRYVAVAYDPEAPSVGWSAPAQNQWVRGTVDLLAIGSDGLSGVDHFDFSLPAGSTSSTTGAATLDTTLLADGPRLLATASVDRAGNRSADSPTRTIRIDNTPPLVSLDAPLGGAAFSGTLALSASASDGGSGIARTRFELRSPGGAWVLLGSDADAPFHLEAPSPAGDGAYDIRSVATDALGNETATVGTSIVVDRAAPAAALEALPATVAGTIALGVDAIDTGSGLARVTYQVAAAGSGTWQTIAAPDSAPFAARWATGQVADGAYALRVVARDRAGNELVSAIRSTLVRNDGTAGLAGAQGSAGANGASAAAPAGAARKKLAVKLRALASTRRVEGGRPVVINGVAPGISRGVVHLTLQNVRSPKLVQQARAITSASGRFRISLIPHFSGRVRVRFAGDERHAVAQTDAGIVRVHPRMVVRITATHTSDGSLTDPHVHGRIVPAGAPVRIAWQARPANGGAWLLFCRSSDQIAVGRNGVIDGTCHVRGLRADNRYRLVLLGGRDGSYLTATTGALVAQPTR